MLEGHLGHGVVSPSRRALWNVRLPRAVMLTHPRRAAMSLDPYDLARFVRAQDGVWDGALREIRAGRKQSHWMWFVFPQAEGLGSSAAAQAYAVKSLGEARAFLAHPVLGPRLVEASEAVAGGPGRTAREVFGTPDDLKLRSSASLFASVAPPGSVFQRVLARYFAGEPDPRTAAWVAAQTAREGDPQAE